MAGSSIIGALRVVLGLDTASYEDGLKGANKKAENFASSVSKIAGGTAIGHILADSLEAVSHQFIEGIKHAIEYADQIGKTAQKVGVPVEELSKLRVAAELSDLSLASLSKGLGILSKNMAQVASGDGAQITATFKSLGISVFDANGKIKNVSTVITELSGKFSNASDGVNKTAAAMQLLGGRIGKEFIPFLNEGTKSLQELSEMAKHFGLVIDKETAERAQKFNDNLKLLKLAGEGFTNQIVAGLLPALVRLSNQFIETASKGDLIKNSAEGVVSFIKEITVAVYQMAVLKDTINALANVLRDIKFPAIFGKNLIADTKTFFGSLSGLSDRLNGARKDAEGLFTAITVGGRKAAEEIDGDLSGKLAKAIADVNFKTAVLSDTFKGLPQGFAELIHGIDPLIKLPLTFDALTGKMRELALAQANLNAQKLTEEYISPWEKYEQQLTRINLLLRLQPRIADEASKASAKAAADMAAAYGTAAQSITGPVADAFKTLASMNKKYAGAAKALAIAEGLVQTYLGAIKAFTSTVQFGLPFAFAAAAAATLAGLANVAKISATEFATGGSFKVGGSGGIDSKLVQFMATPGEMVDVRRPGTTGGSSGGATEVTLRARRLTDMMTLDDLRGLIDNLNSANRDGYKLKFAS